MKRVVFWTDSTICKYWLTQTSRRYKDYVVHRIVDFLEKTNLLHRKALLVRYISSEMNAADIGTRGAILKDLDFDSAWQRGLNFLCKPKSEWPEEPGERVNNDPPERRKFANAGVACVNAGDESAIDLHRYSSLWKAKRMVACVLRCAKKFKAPLTKDDVLVSRQPSLRELQQAETIIILCAQRESFSREISCLFLTTHA